MACARRKVDIHASGAKLHVHAGPYTFVRLGSNAVELSEQEVLRAPLVRFIPVLECAFLLQIRRTQITQCTGGIICVLSHGFHYFNSDDKHIWATVTSVGSW